MNKPETPPSPRYDGPRTLATAQSGFRLLRGDEAQFHREGLRAMNEALVDQAVRLWADRGEPPPGSP